MQFKIYTDGACSGNPGKGGWAAIILDKETIKFTQTEPALEIQVLEGGVQ